MYYTAANFGPNISFRVPSGTDMNNWIKEQYNAGTPVIAYYVLQSPKYETIDLPQLNKEWNDNTIVTDGYITKKSN